MAALRRSGWLEHVPSVGTIVTDAGRWAFDILAFLHKRVVEAELLPTVAGLDYALQIGVDPVARRTQAAPDHTWNASPR